MPLLAELLKKLLQWLIENVFKGFAEQYSRYLAARILYVAVIITAMTALYATMTAAIYAVAAAAPSVLTIPFSWVVPSNLGAVLSARIEVEIVLFGWRWWKQVTLGLAWAPGVKSAV